MDSVQMATSAGRTAGALLTLFNSANRHAAKTFTIPGIDPSLLTVWSSFSHIYL